MADIQKLMTRFDRAKSYSDTFKQIFEDCYKFVIPSRNPYYITDQTRNRNVYDNAAIINTNAFVAQLHATLIPTGMNWANFVAGSEVPDSFKDDINKSLSQINKLFFRYLYASNWDIAANEALYDLAIGTLALLIEETDDDNKPIKFTAVPLNQLILEQTAGPPRNVFRDFEDVPIRDIKNLWPKAVVPEELSEKPDIEHTKTNLREMTVYDEESKTYSYTVIETRTRQVIYEVTGMEKSKWIIARYSVRPMETFGTGVVMDALPTIKTLDKMAEYELASAASQAYPIWMGYSDGMFNPETAQLEPNTIIPIERVEAGQVLPLQPLPQAGNIRFSELKMQDIKMQLNRMFFTEPLGDINSPRMTATEAMIRNQQLLEAREPAFNRLQKEFLSQVIDKVLYILSNRGLIPDLQIDGRMIDVKYEIPVAKSQGMANVSKLLQGVQTIQSIGGPQSALLTLKLENASPYIYEQLGVDPTLYHTQAEITQTLQAQQQAQQQQQQMAQLPQAPQAAVPFQGLQ